MEHELPKTIKDLGRIDVKELELLFYLRTRFRYGDVTIQVRDGLPYRILKAFDATALGTSR